MQLSLDQVSGLCRMAALGAGASEEAARSLAAATAAAFLTVLVALMSTSGSALRPLFGT